MCELSAHGASFQTAAGMVNVVIFPVTIEGRNASLQTLTPVMLLPEASAQLPGNTFFLLMPVCPCLAGCRILRRLQAKKKQSWCRAP